MKLWPKSFKICTKILYDIDENTFRIWQKSFNISKKILGALTPWLFPHKKNIELIFSKKILDFLNLRNPRPTEHILGKVTKKSIGDRWSVILWWSPIGYFKILTNILQDFDQNLLRFSPKSFEIFTKIFSYFYQNHLRSWLKSFKIFDQNPLRFLPKHVDQNPGSSPKPIRFWLKLFKVLSNILLDFR